MPLASPGEPVNQTGDCPAGWLMVAGAALSGAAPAASSAPTDGLEPVTAAEVTG